MLAIIASWVPSSTILPLLKTTIWSAFWIVDSLWAITRVVIFYDNLDSVFWIYFSFTLSRAEVASSNINNCGFLRMARAIAILCFCPPDIWVPEAPTKVSNPFYILQTKSYALAFFKASIISSSVASYLANKRFSLIDRANIAGSCPT